MTGKRESARPAFPGNRAGRPDGQRYRPKTSGAVSIWQPTGCYTMTEAPGLGGGQRRKSKATAALSTGSPPMGSIELGTALRPYGLTALRGYKDLMCKTILIAAATRRANEMTS